MRTWFRIWPIFFSFLLTQACVATGTKEITDNGVTGRIEAGKSTKGEVSAILGWPAIVNYGKQGEESWEYYYVTEYPQATQFIPVANALVESFTQDTKALTVTFDRKDLVKDLRPAQATGSGAVFPY